MLTAVAFGAQTLKVVPPSVRQDPRRRGGRMLTRLQACLCVRQQRWRGTRALRDYPTSLRELAIRIDLGIASAVESHGRPQLSGQEVKAHEIALGERSPDHKAIPLAGMTDVFELVLELIAPETVHVAVRGPGAKDGSCGGCPLLFGVVVMLDPHAPEDGMKVIGHVTGGKYAGQVGATRFIDQDSVPGRNPGALDELDVRFDPDCHDHEVARNSPTLFGQDRK